MESGAVHVCLVEHMDALIDNADATRATRICSISSSEAARAATGKRNQSDQETVSLTGHSGRPSYEGSHPTDAAACGQRAFFTFT